MGLVTAKEVAEAIKLDKYGFLGTFAGWMLMTAHYRKLSYSGAYEVYRCQQLPLRTAPPTTATPIHRHMSIAMCASPRVHCHVSLRPALQGRHCTAAAVIAAVGLFRRGWACSQDAKRQGERALILTGCSHAVHHSYC